MILNELFQNVAEFRKYSPYAESNIHFQELNSSAMSARKQIVIILSREVYDEVAATEGERKEALRSALANLTLGKQMIFDVISRRKSEIDIYKHEQEAMRRAYIDNYYNAMDTLIQLLSSGETSEAWTHTRYNRMLKELRIKTTEEFDALYPIDLSYLFFFRTLSLQREALDNGLAAYFIRAGERDDIIPLLLRCLAKQTVVIALRRFDLLEFPSTIRGLFEDSKVTRSGMQEQQYMLALADSLQEEVRSALRDIDLLLSSDKSEIVDTETSFSREDDKIYLMP